MLNYQGVCMFLCFEDSENPRCFSTTGEVETAEADERHSLQRAKHSGRAQLGIHRTRDQPAEIRHCPNRGGFGREMGPLISQKI